MKLAIFFSLLLCSIYVSANDACQISDVETTVLNRDFTRTGTISSVSGDESCNDARRECERAGFSPCAVVSHSPDLGGGRMFIHTSCTVRGAQGTSRRLSPREFCGKINACMLSLLGDDRGVDAARLTLARELFEVNRCRRHANRN